MNREIMLIASDYDGTLNQGGRIDAHTRNAINQWREAGRYFGVVTGRALDFFDTAAQQNLPFDFLILYNGSLVVSRDRTVIFQSMIPTETLIALENAMAEYDDAVSFQKFGGKPEPHYYASFETPERALQVQAELEGVFADKVRIFVNGPHINIGNPGTGKAQGVSIILRHFSLPADGAAVVGDDYNDLEMILAHNGWAIETGKPDVVAKAPHTCKSVGDLIESLLGDGYPIRRTKQ
jgi:hydroxymethylpyrimidine pyrophosphatase-like HAD family hydrolase